MLITSLKASLIRSIAKENNKLKKAGRCFHKIEVIIFPCYHPTLELYEERRVRYLHFIPSEQQQRDDLIFGDLSDNNSLGRQCLLSQDYLTNSQIRIESWHGDKMIFVDKATTFTLLRHWSFFRLKTFNFFYSSKWALRAIPKVVNIFKTLKPLKTKNDIYKALLKNKSFLRTGTFYFNELSAELFGKSHFINFKRYQLRKQSLEWVLSACVQNGEMLCISPKNGSNKFYKVLGVGINEFTKLEEYVKNQKAARRSQRAMVVLTAFIAIATIVQALNTFDKSYLLKLFEKVSSWLTFFFI